MSKINDLTESWNGHTHKEVETFLKEQLEGGGGSGVEIIHSDYNFQYFKDGNNTLLDNETLLEMLLTHPVFCFVHSGVGSGFSINNPVWYQGMCTFEAAFSGQQNMYLMIGASRPYAYSFNSGCCGGCSGC